MGSISQKFFKFSFDLFVEISSETIGMSGVMFLIFSIKTLLTSISPFVTGVLSALISSISPFALNSNEISPAFKKISINSSTIFLLFFLHFQNLQ